MIGHPLALYSRHHVHRILAEYRARRAPGRPTLDDRHPGALERRGDAPTRWGVT